MSYTVGAVRPPPRQIAPSLPHPDLRAAFRRRALPFQYDR